MNLKKCDCYTRFSYPVKAKIHYLIDLQIKVFLHSQDDNYLLMCKE